MKNAALFMILTGAVLMLAFASSASARACADFHPVVAKGTTWAVYTGESPQELENVSCAQARGIARRMLVRHEGTKGWRCNARLRRCVRGGTYVDSYGHRQWRYLVGWFRADD